MPVNAIPFKSPAPFALPPHIADALAALPFEQAARQVIELMLDAGCADVLVMGRVEGDRFVAGPALGIDDAATSVAVQAADDLGATTGEGVMARALAAKQPLLLMGEVVANEADCLPGPLKTYLLDGQARANLGFVYVFPVLDAAGAARGALLLARPLSTGPLNHDQPAIAAALVELLAAHAG